MDHQNGTDQQGGCLEEGASRLSRVYVSWKTDPQVEDSGEEAAQLEMYGR